MKPINNTLASKKTAKIAVKATAKTIPAMQRSILSLCISSAFLLPALSGNAVADSNTVTNTANKNVSGDIAHKKPYNITAGSLGDALNLFAQQSAIALTYNTDYVKDLTTKGLKGNYSISQGLAILLNNSHLAAKQTRSGYTIEKSAQKSSNIVGTLALTTVTSGNRFGDAPQEQGGFKAEYQSTTSKMAMKIIDTPQAISAVTRDALDARLVNNIASAVELTPSISGNDTGVFGGVPDMFGGYGHTSNFFTIRGQQADIRTDGFKIASYYGDDDGMDMAAFDRIEVVRGPAGFYGQGSLGGFINKVRKKPQAEFGANLSVQAGSYDTYRAEAGITGAINDDETLRGRVDVAYEDTGAFVNDINNERIFIAPSIEAIINDNTRILMQLTYQKDEYDANPGIPIQTIGNRVELFEKFSSRTELYGTSGDKSSKENYMASITVNHELSDRWLVSLYLQKYKQKRNFVNGNYASVYNYNNYGDYVYSAHIKDNNEADNWAGELRLQGSFGAFKREHQVLFGLETNRKNGTREWGSSYNYDFKISLDDYDGELGNIPSVPSSEIEIEWENKNKSTNHAIYGQVLFNVLDNTKLLLATRYDVANTDNWASYFATEKTQDSVWTSRLGFVQTINDNINVYASYGQSFTPVSETGRNGRLDPITGEGYELGLKTTWFGEQLGANLSLYQQELDNRPIVDPANNRDESFSISGGMHLTKGIELELNGSLYPGWTIGGTASLMDNEFTEENDANKGLSFNGRVDKQASLYSSYQVQQGKLKGLAIGGTFVYMGERNYIIENAQVYANGYNRLDLNISYQGLASWDINFLVRNITNETYLSGVYTSDAFRGAPHSVLFQATYNFD